MKLLFIGKHGPIDLSMYIEQILEAAKACGESPFEILTYFIQLLDRFATCVEDCDDVAENSKDFIKCVESCSNNITPTPEVG